jgi:deazaflavin-dependent oxidoreductase (nitroreductase family)
MVNRMVAGRIRKGRMDDNTYLLTTLGRKSGLERTTPVTLASSGGTRYLVSPYGNVGWVHNVRAAGLAELSRGDTKEEISLVEVDAQEAAPILKKYMQDLSMVRPFFDAAKDAPVEAFVAEASRHPVFRIS